MAYNLSLFYEPQSIADIPQTRQPLVLDFETSGLDPHADQIIGMAVGGNYGTTYIPYPKGEDIQAVIDLADPLICHYGAFDLAFAMFQHDIRLPAPDRLFDTYIAARLYGYDVDAGGLSLLKLYEEFVGPVPDAYKRTKTMRQDLSKMPLDVVAEYARQDVKFTYELYKRWEDHASDKLFRREMAVHKVCMDAARRGIPLRSDVLKDTINQFERRLIGIKRELIKQGINNPNSSRQTCAALGVKSSRREVLEKLDTPLAALVREYRAYSKALSSWLYGLQGKDRVHSILDVAGTVSGRLSCRDPNMQAFPLRSNPNLPYSSLRHVLGDFWQIDYKQADVRMAAALARDDHLIKDLTSSDPYIELARRVWPNVEIDPERRQLAKRCLLASINAIGVHHLAKQLGVSVPQARELMRGVRRAYYKTFRYGDRISRRFAMSGYVNLWTGRKIRRRKDDNDSVAFSRVTQGGVAEVAKDAMLIAGDRLLLQIHDSILVECDGKEVEELAKEIEFELSELVGADNFTLKMKTEVKQ